MNTLLQITWNVDPVIFHLSPTITKCCGLLMILGAIITGIKSFYKKDQQKALPKQKKKEIKEKQNNQDTAYSWFFVIIMLLFGVFLFRVGHLELRYYGILFMSGFVIGYYMFVWFFNRENLPVSLLETLLILLIGCTVIGSRFGHVLFYQPEYYLANPSEIFKVWEGGLASHGGTIAIMIGIWWYVKKYGSKYKFDYLWLLDRLAVATAFAAMFIRLGNLMNSEIYGHQTDAPWGFVFVKAGETVAKHPTQLYEALCYFVTGLVLLVLYRYANKRIYRGLLLGIFFIGIFFSRFLIEFVKENQVDFEQGMVLNMGQLLSIPFVLLGAFLIVRSFIVKTPFEIK